MSNIKKVTSFTHHITGEGDRLSYTYSEIDVDGNVVKSNERLSCLVMDIDILEHIKEVNKFLQGKIDLI